MVLQRERERERDLKVEWRKQARVLLWFRMSRIILGVWTFAPQQVALFGDIIEPLRGGASLEEVGHKGVGLIGYNLVLILLPGVSWYWEVPL